MTVEFESLMDLAGMVVYRNLDSMNICGSIVLSRDAELKSLGGPN